MLSRYYNHQKFILTPLFYQIRNVVASASSVGQGIEFSAINDYVLHSMFMQMTGAQEQKLKCIVWDIANTDMQYRYDRYDDWKLGECSRLEDKNTIFKDLREKICELSPTYKLFVDANAKRAFLNGVLNDICSVLDNSSFVKTHGTLYADFKNVWSNLSPNNIDGGTQLIKSATKNTNNDDLSDQEQLYGIYRLLYKHRNRCAHNLLSYQDNLPPLWEMRDQYIQRHYNIFLFMATLVLFDRMFVSTYSELLRLRTIIQ